MTDIKDLLQRRRSHRRFLADPVSEADEQLLLRAGLLSPTSKGCRAWHFYVVRDAARLQALSACKAHGAELISGAQLAIVVACDPAASECWVEDCSAAAMAILLQAEDLGLGACWVQIRGRQRADGTDAEPYVQELLQMPAAQQPLCALAIGHKADERRPQNEDKLKWDQVHRL